MISKMDNRRDVELDCLCSIFPEIQRDPTNRYTARLLLDVRPQNQINVVFVPTLDNHPFTSEIREQKYIIPGNDVKPYKISYLPPLNLSITLPDDYPGKSAPEIDLSMKPKWLPDVDLNKLKLTARNLWEQSDGNEVLYEIIDFLYHATENAFGYSEKDKVLEVLEDFRIYMLDFDINETQAAFKKKTFNCGICLDPKKGDSCYQMLDCKHVFCIKCLQDFYLNAINNGDVVSVRCPAAECLQKCKENQEYSKKQLKIKTLSPSELLQIPLDHELVTRFVKLKYKSELESDKNTIYCPRKWCEGAARSTKYRKPLSLNDMPSTYDQSESESENADNLSSQKSLLSVCEECLFAFCNRCFQTWHGELNICAPRVPGDLSEEDKASLDYIKYHTTACPTCGIPSQKSHGCNHMICFRCNTHFCYLCSNWLSPSNPYKHYNTLSSSCYMRLWELEEGDAEDLAINAEGRRQNLIQGNDFIIREAEIPIIAIQEVEEAPNIVGAINEFPAPSLPEIQREGPLVLRINHVPRPAQRNMAQEPNEAPPKRFNRRRRDHNIRRSQRVRVDNEANPILHNNQLLVDEGEANQRWVQRFVQLALNDEEDLIDWNSDDELDHIAWEIPIR
ncbi:E3 ubiquitin-protein ligase itt1 [Erysiphe necator]|nr:E3 ubiquitin-protein ligase itt1 [Erysiphe necator]